MAGVGRSVLVIVAIVVILVIFRGTAEPPPPDQLAGLIAALKEKFQARRIHIMSGMYEGMCVQNSQRLIRLQKDLSARGLQSHHEHVEYFFWRRGLFANGSRVSRSMHVFIAEDVSARPILLYISNSYTWGFTVVYPVVQHGGEFVYEQNPLWVVWLGGDIDVFFNQFYIPMNSQFYVAQYRDADQQVITLTEVYHVARHHPLQKRVCGNYSADTDTLSWTTVPFFERRGDLQGLPITAVTTHTPPHTLVEFSDNEVKVSGAFGHFWKILEQKMNFTTKYAKHKLINAFEGILDLWNLRNDVAIIDYPIVFSQEAAFTAPLFITRYFVFIREPVEDGPGWNIFLDPLDSRLWLCYGLLLLLLAGGAAVCSGTRRLGAVPGYLFNMVGVATTQGPDDGPDRTPSRILYLSSYILVIVMTAAYSANIIAHLTVIRKEMPFQDIEGMFENGKYTFGVSIGSGEETALQFNRDPIFQAMYGKQRRAQNLHPVGHPWTLREGLEMVCNSSYAFFARPDQVLANSDKLPCKLVALPKFYMAYNVALCVRRDLAYRDFLSYYITKMRNSGILGRLLRGQVTINTPKDPVVPEVGLQNMKPILVLMLVAMVTASLILAREACSRRRGDPTKRKWIMYKLANTITETEAAFRRLRRK